MIELLAELFGIEQDFSPNPAKQEAALRRLLDEPQRACILVARDTDNSVIGMVTGQLVLSTAEGAPSVWIEDMVVRRDHRGRGLGRALLQSILQWARSSGATRAQLLVDTDNAPAVAYYDKLNWQSTHLAARRLLL